MKKISLSFLVFIGVLLALYFGFSTRAYPVATVNDTFISARAFGAVTTAATTYYTHLLEISGATSSTDQTEFTAQMRQAAMQGLIEDQLVLAELRKEYEPAALSTAIKARVDKAFNVSEADTSEAVSELFGMNVADFKEFVLEPEARVELLVTNLQARNLEFKNWLDEQLLSARVSIAVSDLTWKNGKVELTGVQPYTAKVKEVLDQLGSSVEALKDRVVSSTASSSLEAQ